MFKINKKEILVDIVGYIFMYAIIPVLYLYVRYEGIGDNKADIFQMVGMLTIVIIWLMLCMKITDKIKNLIKS